MVSPSVTLQPLAGSSALLGWWCSALALCSPFFSGSFFTRLQVDLTSEPSVMSMKSSFSKMLPSKVWGSPLHPLHMSSLISTHEVWSTRRISTRGTTPVSLWPSFTAHLAFFQVSLRQRTFLTKFHSNRAFPGKRNAYDFRRSCCEDQCRAFSLPSTTIPQWRQHLSPRTLPVTLQAMTGLVLSQGRGQHACTFVMSNSRQ